jgi:hypothetical protein
MNSPRRKQKPDESRALLLLLSVLIALNGCDGVEHLDSTRSQSLGSATVMPSFAGVRESIDRPADAGRRAEIQYRQKLATLVSDPEYLSLLNKKLDDSSFVILKVNDQAVADVISSIYRERQLDRRSKRLRDSRAWARSHPIQIILGHAPVDLGQNRAMVVRPGGSVGRVLVVLANDPTAMDVALAYRMIFEIRDFTGDFVDHEERIMVPPGRLPAPSDRLREYDQLLRQLRNGKPRNVDGIHFSIAVATRLGHLRAPSGVLSKRDFRDR